MLLLFFLLSCSSSGLPEQVSDCPDAACRQQWAVATWPVDPKAVGHAVANLNDPVEQIALTSALTEKYAGQVGDLCDQLPKGPSLNHCKKLNGRPHLFETPSEEGGRAKSVWRVGPFASAADPPLPDNPFAEVPADEAGCGDEPATSPCRFNAAADFTRARKIEQAAAVCNSISDTRWRSECFFQSAETLIPAGGGKGLRVTRIDGALDLCLGAGDYLSRCYQHLVDAIGSTAPASDASDPADWKKVISATSIARDSASEHAPRLGELLEDRIWAAAMATSAVRASTISGDGFDHTPAKAHPHLRAALAKRYLAEHSTAQTNLNGLHQGLMVALAERSDTAGTSTRTAKPISKTRWAQNVGAESDLPWVHHLGISRRTYVEDAELDALICLLEAAADQDKPNATLLMEGMQHSDERVRWTAVRLLSDTRSAQASKARLQLGDDPSALVQARVKKGPERTKQARPKPPTNRP